jgi:hypothetical protein
LALPVITKIEGGVHGSAGGVALDASCVVARVWRGLGRHGLPILNQKFIEVPDGT